MPQASNSERSALMSGEGVDVGEVLTPEIVDARTDYDQMSGPDA